MEGNRISLFIFCVLWCLRPLLVGGRNIMIECYCNFGNDCNHGRCWTDPGNPCAAQVITDQGVTTSTTAEPSLRYFCQRSFIRTSCSSEDRADYITCCSTSLCNHCLLPDGLPRDLATRLGPPPQGCPTWNLTSSHGDSSTTSSSSSLENDPELVDDYFVPAVVVIVLILVLILILLLVGIGLLIHMVRSRVIRTRLINNRRRRIRTL